MRELFAGRRGRIAVGLLVAEFVTATQALVIAATMPRIASDLHGVAAYPLAFGAFFIAFAISLPFAGPWADRYGPRRIYGLALGLLASGLILVAIAPSMLWFTIGRAIEGAANGLDYAVTFAIIAKTFDDELRPRMFALTSTMWILPAIVGPALGAYVAMSFGWRWSFAGFLPLVALAAVLVMPVVDSSRAQGDHDPFAALRLLFAPGTFRLERGLAATFVAFATLHAAFLGGDAYAALMLTTAGGVSLQAASFCITFAALGWSGTAMFQPALQKRWGARALVAVSGLACALGLASMIAVTLGAKAWIAYAGWAIAGAGAGFAYATLSLLALAKTTPGREGTVSSATTLAALLGIVGGVLLCGAPVALGVRGTIAMNAGLATCFSIALALAACLFLLAGRVESEDEVVGGLDDATLA